MQAAVGADYKFNCVYSRNSRNTHDSTAFQEKKLHSLLDRKGFPIWANIAADDTYCVSNYILAPYSEYNLIQEQNSFNFYLSLGRITVEQAFSRLKQRFGIFWSALKCSVAQSSLVVVVACKLHTHMIDSNPDCYLSHLETADINKVAYIPLVQRQGEMRTDLDSFVSTQRQPENSSVGNVVAERPVAMGFIRPRSRR